MNQKPNLKPVWEAILCVYKEFARICEKHNLRFYVTDGSAIGAIRHKGFIPWDDDLDISMPREDYCRFLEIAKDELPPHLKTLSIEENPEYNALFAKVIESRREVVEDVEHKIGYTLTSGIYIDIFPIDGWSGSRFEFCLNKIRYFMLSCVDRFQHQTFGVLSWRGRFAWILGAVLNPFYSKMSAPTDTVLAYQSIYGVRPCGDCSSTARVRCWPDRRLILRSDIWGVPTYVDFCGIKVPVPEKYDEYLRQDYGDYMKLPPEEKRRTTHSKDGYHHPWYLGPIEK